MTKVGLAVHRTFHSFHSRNFRLFFAGQFVSVTGTWMQSVATAWLVLQLTHSGTALGIVTGLTFAPALLIGAWGGLIADRFDKRKVLIATQSAAAILAVALWVPVAFGTVSLSFVYVIALLNGIVTALDNPTRQSFYAEMVGPKDIPNAISLNSAVMTGTRIVGPAIAGIIIATHGVGPVFLVNAISYIAVIVGLLTMRPSELHRTGAIERGRGQVREGLRYVMDRPVLRNTLALMGVIFLFSFNFSVILPLMAERTFGGGAHTLGWLFSSMGVGSLAGALLAAAKPRHSFRRLALFGVLTGLAIAASAVAPTRAWALIALALVGFTSITFMISGNSALQLNSSDRMRGRVMSLYATVFLGSTPFGATLTGWVGQHFGPRLAMAGAGVIAIGASALALILLRRMRSRQVARAAPQIDVTGVPQPVSA